MTGSQERSFLDLYFEYTKEQESPEMFHLWVAYTLIGAVLGKKCYVDRGRYRIYPNLFTVLVSGSAWARKSTAVDIGVSFLRDVSSLLVIDGRITPERFIHRLGENQIYHPEKLTPVCKPCLIHADELNVFLTRQSYADPMIGILTRIYSCPGTFSNETKHSGSAFLHDPYVSILACTTPVTIAKSISPSALEEGFGNRVFWIYQDATDKVIPFPAPEDEEASKTLAKALDDISTLSGEYAITPKAKEWFTTWYKIYRNTPPPDPRIATMYARKHDHIFKLGIILASAAGTKTIDVHHCEAALMSLDQMESFAPQAFVEMGGDEQTARVARLRQLMHRIGRGQYSYILRRMLPITAAQFKEAIETGFDAGWLKRDSVDGKVLVYVNIDELNQSGVR